MWEHMNFMVFVTIVGSFASTKAKQEGKMT
jgi:hypothetical protein